MLQAPDYSQSHNRYSYVLNNPLKYIDPSGMEGRGYDWMNEAMGAYWEENGIHSNAEERYNEWFEKGSNAVHDVNVNGKVVGTFNTMHEARETADMFKMGFILPDIEIKDVPTKGHALVQYTLDHLDDYARGRANNGGNDWAQKTQTGLGAFDLAHGAKEELINYAAKSSPAINEMQYVKAVKVASKGLFGAQALISTYQTYDAFRTNNANAWSVAGKAGLDITIGAISTFGGPVGWGVGAVYFIGDAAGWWGNWGQPTSSPLNINKK